MYVPFSISKGSFDNLKNLPLKEGALYFCVDTQQIFADLKDDSGILTRIEFSDNESEGNGGGTQVQIIAWGAND